MIKVAINGFGRIGRTALKVWFDKHRDDPSTHAVNSGQAGSGPGGMQIVAVNDLVDAKTLANFLKYDSNYGIWSRNGEGVSSGKADGGSTPKAPSSVIGVEPLGDDTEGKEVGQIAVDGVAVKVFATKDPTKLPWKDLGIDVVIESSGKFTDKEGMSSHLAAGAKKVVLSAPSKDSEVGTFLLGVNEDKYSGETLINNASCTTNCIAPVAAVISDKLGVKKAMMTTIHGYTADQNLQDGPHKDLRRARAAAVNIVPTSTGAAIATTEAIPELKGLFGGLALRVPVPVASISDLTFLLAKKTTVEEVNGALEAASKEKRFEGILAVTTEPLVSTDIIGRSESAIVDLSLTQVVDGDMVKVFAWYDNEFGYSNRLIEQVIQVGKFTSS